MFPTNHEDLLPGGRLYSCVQIMGANLVQSYNYMRRFYKPTDPFVTKMTKIAETVGVDIGTLTDWSTQIEEDFINSNTMTLNASSIDQVVPTINSYSKILTDMHKRIMSMELSLKNLSFNLNMDRLINI